MRACRVRVVAQQFFSDLSRHIQQLFVFTDVGVATLPRGALVEADGVLVLQD